MLYVGKYVSPGITKIIHYLTMDADRNDEI